MSVIQHVRWGYLVFWVVYLVFLGGIYRVFIIGILRCIWLLVFEVVYVVFGSVFGIWVIVLGLYLILGIWWCAFGI